MNQTAQCFSSEPIPLAIEVPYTTQEIEDASERLGRLLQAVRLTFLGLRAADDKERARTSYDWLADVVEDAMDAHATLYEVVNNLLKDDAEAESDDESDEGEGRTRGASPRPRFVTFRAELDEQGARDALIREQERAPDPEWLPLWRKLSPQYQQTIADIVRSNVERETQQAFRRNLREFKSASRAYIAAQTKRVKAGAR